MFGSSTPNKAANTTASEVATALPAGLSALKLVANQAQKGQSPQQARRQKLSTKLDEQIQLAQAQQAGSDYAPTKTRMVKDEATGESRRVQVPKKLKPWWWTADNGKTCITLRYGARVVEIAKGMNAIEANGMAEVITCLQILKTAAQAGDLDAVLETLSTRDKTVGDRASDNKPAVEKKGTLKLPARSV